MQRFTSIHQPFRLRALSAALATGSLAFTAIGAQAQTPVANILRDYDFPAGVLATTLNRIAVDAGLALSVEPALVEGRRSQSVRGRFDAVTALREALRGSGLQLVQTAAGTYTLEQLPDAGTVTLKTVRVEAGGAFDMPPEPDGFKAEYQRSATKMPTSLRDTPQAISVITRDSLESRQVQTLGQALEMSAGVTQYSGNGPFAGQPSFGFNQTTIRGIAVDDIYDFREDGFVNGSFYAITDLAIYERIEVVKGPSSMLYGRGSAAGLINRIRKQPQAQARTEIGFSVGSWENYRLDLDTTGPLNDSASIQGRLVAVYEDAQSFVKGAEIERTVLAPSVRFELTPSTRLLLHALYQSEEIVPNTGTPLRATGSGFDAPDISRRQYNGVLNRDPYTWEIFSGSAQLEQDLGDDWLATLRINTNNIDTPIQVDGYAYGAGQAVPSSGDVAVVGNEFHLDRDIWSGELQLAGRFDLWGREANAAFGADWNENEYTRRGAYVYSTGNLYEGVFNRPDLLQLEPGSATAARPISRGAYAQVQVWPTERLAVLLGVRYDQVRLRTVPYHSAAGPTPAEQREILNETTGRIGATYNLSDNVSIYSIYSMSFTPELSATDLDGNLLDPQTGELYEVGLKSDWFDGKLGVTTAVYRVDRENIATFIPDGNPPAYQTSGVQRSDGFEVEVNGQPLPGWDISFAYNHVNSDYLDRNDPLYGHQPGGTPGWQLGLHTKYELQSGPLQGFGVGATLFAIDDRGIGFAPGTIPGYERVDLHAFYNGFDKTKVSVLVRNVTDEVYIEGADRASGFAQFGSPTALMLTVRHEL